MLEAKDRKALEKDYAKFTMFFEKLHKDQRFVKQIWEADEYESFKDFLGKMDENNNFLSEQEKHDLVKKKLSVTFALFDD